MLNLLRLRSRFLPIYCNLILTRACNLRCKSCGVWKHPSKHCSTEEMKRVIDKVSKIYNVGHIGITGGESLQRDNVYEIIDYISEKGIFVSINSNGTLPKEKYQKLLDSKIDNIGISLHFLTPKKQDEFCGMSGAFDKIVKNIRYLRANNSRKFIYVQCTVTGYNYKEVIKLKKFVNEKLKLPFMITPATWSKEDAIWGVRTCNEGVSKVDTDFGGIKKELKKFFGMRVMRGKTFLDIAFKQFETGEKCWNCEAGERYFAVSPDGRFCICQDIDTNLFILDEKFEEKLRSRKTKKMISKMRDECSGCTYPCYLEPQTLKTHPWEVIPLGISHRYNTFRYLMG